MPFNLVLKIVFLQIDYYLSFVICFLVLLFSSIRKPLRHLVHLETTRKTK